MARTPLAAFFNISIRGTTESTKHGACPQGQKNGEGGLLLFCAPGMRTIRMGSFDVRSEGQSGGSLGREGVMVQRRWSVSFQNKLDKEGGIAKVNVWRYGQKG
jgi:hypothetical protein